ncbi:MAG: DUF899 domain-containing protein [Nitratireductor rhodophyticola]|uniref:DUF899 domain-containing protein n=1 Tax=Nitratireductor rhodophyticola TaxID=2854036 RepID=UPI002E9D3CD8|nr:DUF899 domain-containing protein [Pseudomonadota bacterium]
MEPQTVSREEWRRAREALLAKEKAHTRAGDALAAERRLLPRVRIEKDYRFVDGEGSHGLEALFEGRRQLIVYHHMLKPADPAPCSGCSMFVDNLGDPAHLNARDTSLALVSRAPVEDIEAFRKRMGWTLPWYSVMNSTFNADHGVEGGFGLNVFLREGGSIYHTYHTSGRGVEALGTSWTLLDLTPYGRQETWEASPEGTPQSAPYRWWRLHDEYA